MTSTKTKAAIRKTAKTRVAITSGLSQPWMLPVVRAYTKRMTPGTDNAVPRMSNLMGRPDHLLSPFSVAGAAPGRLSLRRRARAEISREPSTIKLNQKI